ncbi:MAG: YcxB family protein [Oscillospiraceae bacterium]|nr:YcxB family protein [Oscillospiraceae bacterium]
METLFENRYTTNFKMLRSFARGASLSQKIFFRFSIVGMIVCALALIYCFIFLPGDWGSLVSPAVSFVLCLMLFFFPSLTARVVCRNTQKLHGGTIPETTVLFSADEITMTEGTLSVRFRYSQIIKVRETGNLSVLMLGRDSGIILVKNAFIIGDFEHFQPFIREKCTNLKGKR